MANNGGSSSSSSQPRNSNPVPVNERPSTQQQQGQQQQQQQQQNGFNHAGRGSRKSTVSSAAVSTHSHSTLSLSVSNRQSESFQHRAVRTLPTWVQEPDYDDDDDEFYNNQKIAFPPPTHKNQGKSIHDGKREHDPVTMGPTVTTGSRWRTFVDGSHHRPASRSQHAAMSHNDEKGSPDWLLEDSGNLEEPWLASQRKDKEAGEADGMELPFVNARRRRIWYKRIQNMLLNNPMVPLTFRAMIWILSLFALAFASSVYVLSNKYGFSQKPSTIMAIVVDIVAMVYLIYITYDEYSGKPLGLRSPKAKMRLIMFDLFFIIFDSANVALAFDSLFDQQWSCVKSPLDVSSNGSGNSTMTGNSKFEVGIGVNQPICRRQRALASFLFMALCAWVSTFTVSVFRLVERVSRNIGA